MHGRWSFGPRSVAVGCAALVLGACVLSVGAPSPSPSVAAPATPLPTIATPEPTPTPTPSPAATASPPEGPLVAADDPAGLAAQIDASEHAIRDANVIGAALVRMGRLQQLAYRRLSTRPDWRDAVLAIVSADIRKAAAANIDATTDLRATVVPGPDLPAWLIVEPAPLDDLLRYYREAEAEFGVPWSYLASINLVETRLGRIRGTSTAGAQGPMQFLPSTWAAFGDGDINSDRDSIRAAARYLRSNGAPGDMANALFRYNHSDRYVRAVTAYAEVMRAEPSAFRGYYQWQVYYLTTRGDVLLPVGYGR